MLNRTAARRRPLSRIGYATALLALVGVVTALVVVVRVPAHSTTQPPPPAPPGRTASREVPVDGGAPVDLTNSGTTGHRNGTGAGDRYDVTPPAAGSRGPAVDARRHASAPDGVGDATEALHRSLVWSGLLGLVISLTGLGIVGSRRRMW